MIIKTLFIGLFLILNYKSYAEALLKKTNCNHVFKDSENKINSNKYIDYFEKLLPTDNEIQKSIYEYKTNLKKPKKIEALLYKLERLSFTKKNDDYLIQQLSSQPKLLDFTNEEGQSLLLLAVIYDRPKVVDFLVQFKKLLNKKDKNGNYPLLLSITRANRIKTFKTLIMDPSIDLSARDSFNQNVFHYIFLGNPKHREEILNLLFERLDYNLVVNLINSGNKTGESPINYLIRDFNIDIANKFLESAPIDFSQKLRNGDSLLHTANSIPDNKAIEFLLENAPIKNQKNNRGNTPQ